MLRQNEIMQTLDMIDHQHLDIRTITMGISLRDCCGPDPKKTAQKIYDKITSCAEKLVPTGEAIERELGIPIVNKRISVTPIALVADCLRDGRTMSPFAVGHGQVLPRQPAASICIGGFSALVHKGMHSWATGS